MDSDFDDKKNNRLYDPDITNIIVIVLTTIASVGCIVNALDSIYQKQEKNTEKPFIKERLKYVELRLAGFFRKLSVSFDSIRQGIELLERTSNYSLDSKSRTEKREFSFGNFPIVLDVDEFKLYKNEQGKIFDEVVKVHELVFLIEEIIAENIYLFRNRNYIVNKRLQAKLRQTIEDVNELMQKFGRISIEEFIRETIQLCFYIEAITGFKDEKPPEPNL